MKNPEYNFSANARRPSFYCRKLSYSARRLAVYEKRARRINAGRHGLVKYGKEIVEVAP